jgi:hypothetical protein
MNLFGQQQSGGFSPEELKQLEQILGVAQGGDVPQQQGLSLPGFGGGSMLQGLMQKMKAKQDNSLLNQAKASAGEQYGFDVGAAGIYGVPDAMPKGLALGKYGLPAVYGYITQGSQQAQGSLMDAYRSAYAQRAAGIAGSYGLQMDQLASDMAGQGLSADIVRRMRAGQQGATLQQLGEAQGQAANEYYTSLAQLQKGTGTELAAAKQAEIEQLLAPHIAKISGDAAIKAGKAQGKGSLLGGLIGGIGQIAGASILAGV